MNEWIYLSTQKQNNIGLETELRKVQSVDRTPRKAMSPLTEAASDVVLKLAVR